MRPLLPLAAVCAAFALAACGGPSKDDAVDTATDWMTAVQEGDGAAACKLMAATATRGLAAKYAPDARGKPCPEVVAAYRATVGAAKLKAILDGGLEYEGDVTKKRLGVFPKTADYQYEVVLMEIADGEWRVASSGIGRGRQNTG